MRRCPRSTRSSARLAQLVECRFFAGMTEDETAAALGVSLRTVQREWMRARAWLLKTLGTESSLDGAGMNTARRQTRRRASSRRRRSAAGRASRLLDALRRG